MTLFGSEQQPILDSQRLRCWFLQGPGIGIGQVLSTEEEDRKGQLLPLHFRPTFPQLELQTRQGTNPPFHVVQPLGLALLVVPLFHSRHLATEAGVFQHAGRPPSISPFPHHPHTHPVFSNFFFLVSPPLPRAQLTRICKSSAEITPQPDQRKAHTTHQGTQTQTSPLSMQSVSVATI